jgi:peptidoglycan-associated lipoprotein
MTKRFQAIMISALAMPFVAGCATKGFVRKELTAQRTSIDSAMTAGFTAERNERMAGDSALRGEIASLRQDLTALRDTFNVKITALENGMQFAMPVNFAFDDATVREEDKPVLDRFAQVVQKHYAGSKVTVEGFADPAGGVRYNLALSKRRAENVRSYLTEKGLTADQLSIVGYGKTRFVVPGAQKDDPGAEKNRRVVFVIESRPEGAATKTASSPE